MTEKFIHAPVPPEIATTRKWVEEVIIGKSLCPPMVYLARDHALPEGGVDWENMKRYVNISTHFSSQPTSNDLIVKVGEAYYRFLKACAEGTEQLARLFVLPDFAANRAYDLFVAQMKAHAMEKLATNDGQKVTRKIIKKRMAEGKYQTLTLQTDISESQRKFFERKQVVDNIFVAGQFYGRDLTDDDLVGSPVVRGPRDRYRMLMRAPYYLIQVVNQFAPTKHDDKLDVARLHTRNTKLALGTNLEEQAKHMRSLRDV